MKKLYAVIHPDGRIEQDEAEFTLEFFQGQVGGYIEAVTVGNGSEGIVGFCNEEGKLKGLAPNTNATRLCPMLMPGDIIAGSFVLVGEIDTEGYETALPADWRDRVGIKVIR